MVLYSSTTNSKCFMPFLGNRKKRKREVGNHDGISFLVEREFETRDFRASGRQS